MILTKQQEHLVYINMLDVMDRLSISNCYVWGLCDVLHGIHFIDNNFMPELWRDLPGCDRMIYLSKLYNMRPEPEERYGPYWFHLNKEGFERRVELVKKAIELTK